MNDEYPKYLYNLVKGMSIGDILLFQNIEYRKDIIAIFKLFIDRGVLDTDSSYIEFYGDYKGIARKSRL